MLMLGRRVGESLHIGDGIVVTVTRIEGGKATIGVTAPPDVVILRHEVVERIAQEQKREVQPA